MQIPGLFASAEGAVHIDLAPFPVVDGPPDPGPLKVLENSSEEHVVPLLLDVNTPWPIADVQTIVPELPREELAALLSAQIPNPRSQMGPHRPTDLPPL